MTRAFLFLSVFLSGFTFAQEDLLKDIDTISTTTDTSQPAFKALQIVTGQSTKLAAKKEWYIVVAHRFGDISTGFKNFFGLDNASTKLGVIYGISDAVSVSLSRETNMKTFEGAVKYRLIKQNENFPVDIVGYNVIGTNTELDKDTYPHLTFSDRLSYLTQALISRRFNDKLSVQLTPSYIHKNLYNQNIEDKNQFLAGLGGRYKISKRVSVNAEYFVNFDNHSFYKNPLSLGLDIETGGHVFQLLFTNSQINSDIGYLTNASGNWGKGHIFFGFNLYRVF
ncbi:hypothetical protein EGY07_01380 [Chryseobacterium indologenes]|uniref:Uncharacterized protein n=1 Tax=Chryseobacterium indologenes TaxID=253 RepID=A0A1Z3W4X4_CHRID|nr:DUF5777 family beta-barrel protein [Chryseobacterium indologenes]ASE62798.1 hypothetical protein CEQ15_15470 [Chryseobacterium indologenes]ATN06621.1 hypothetical protein CRN76_15005 [Chryseobacterium indologenes]AYY84618.1 hypothetical protein EGX91_08720 [Chryseobacterium indologenes]AYZ34303.1 hypothetical protein EGY07_01380 [Chryseobacterium indologenes]AZB18497.1 hypothetical protein EG352_12235 [Chryseobacterium indologenes]